MSKLTSLTGGLLIGAGLMYFLDPIRGRGRRRRINEAVVHAERRERDLLGKAARDARHRVNGIVERVKHPGSGDVSDEVIEQRVRARIGHAVSHPRALEVVVVQGRVILRGPIFEGEAAQVLRCAKATPGVVEVVDRLERHVTAANIPSLQGEGRRRRKAKGTWPPAMQASATGAGALLMAYGLLLKRGFVGALLGAAGGALALRGSVNKPLPDLVSRRAGVTVQKSIIVKQPIHVVFDLWSRLDNFPLFMQHVQEVDVQLGGNRSRWTVDGPAGTKVEFEAETIELEPDRVLAWRTVPNQNIEHHGIVRFAEVEGGTRVTVQMTYRPLGGLVGHTIAHILGWDPKARMDDDLVRMKALLEEGRTRAHRQTVELADLH